MHMYYGEVPCAHCHKINKALVENHAEPDAFYVAGDAVKKEDGRLGETIFCENCYQSFPVTVTIEEGQFVGFSNGCDTILKQKENANTSFLVAHHWSTPFEEQPFPLHHKIEENGYKWSIKAVYKKEYTETDENERMNRDFVDCYYYQMENEKGEARWLHVCNEDEENARLSTESPLLLTGETLLDVTDTLFKSHLLFCQEMGMQYDIEAYQHQSGIQLLLIRKEEEERVCVLDLFGDDLESLIARTEELLYARD